MRWDTKFLKCTIIWKKYNNSRKEWEQILIQKKGFAVNSNIKREHTQYSKQRLVFDKEALIIVICQEQCGKRVAWADNSEVCELWARWSAAPPSGVDLAVNYNLMLFRVKFCCAEKFVVLCGRLDFVATVTLITHTLLFSLISSWMNGNERK